MKVFSRRFSGIRMTLRRPWWCLLCIAMVMGLVATPIWASSRTKRHAPVNQEEGVQPSYMKANITIQKKSLKHVFAYGDTFAINAETLIVGSDGKEIKLKKMLVPCDAEVLYLIENGKPTAKRINVKSVASDAGPQWTAEHPQ